MSLREWFGLPVYVNGQAAADLGYVNPGPDRRLGGPLGRILGRAQSQLSFKAETSPQRNMEQVGDIWIETATAPNGRQHVSIAIPRGRGRWATIRAGWRWDPNWGDEYSIGVNPDPHIIGGYVADVVVKLNATRTFIESIDSPPAMNA